MADNITKEMIDGWPPAQRQLELVRLGVSTGGSRSSQVNRLFNALQAKTSSEASVSTSTSASVSSRSSAPTYGKRYCAVCHKHEGQQEDGSKLSLHRIPHGLCEKKKELRKQWIRSLKLFRVDFPSDPPPHFRICDDHFPGGYKPDSVPTSCYKQPASTSRRVIIKKPLSSPHPVSLLPPSSAYSKPATCDVGVQVGASMCDFVEAGC